MTKIIQSSFAARIGKAETLYNALSGFAGYNPGDERLTPEGIRACIKKLYDIQDSHAERFNAFTTAVQARQNIFSGEKPLYKTMTMVKSFVAATYGKHSDKTRNVDTLASKITGEGPVKITTTSGEKSISRSEKSYGAQHVNLVYLISTLTGFGDTYTPANTSITVGALTTLAHNINVANDTAVLAYQAYYPMVVTRQDAFNELAELTQRVKKMVLAQYGSGSVEYKSIKGLNFKFEKA